MFSNRTILPNSLTDSRKVILRLIEHASIDDANLYGRVSGVFFLGCLHHEQSHKFGRRVFWTLMKEFRYLRRDNQLETAWKSEVEWIIAITASFRKLKLPFPVWTYYESVETTHRLRIHYFGRNTECNRIVRAVFTYLHITAN
jgi:hypothetical protein